MRLINQMGTVDVPYELCALSIGGMSGKATIYMRSKALDDKPVAFADYSSEEKAMKIMEMVRNAYIGLPILFQNVDMNESVVDKLKEWNRDGIVLLHDNADSKIEQVNNAVFRFPKDDEVED